MDGRTTTVGRNTSERTKKDSLNGVFKNGGQGWIRTTVVSRRQIYSLLPLATRAPTHIKFSINLPLTGFEPVASPLPRECATPAPQRHLKLFSPRTLMSAYLSKKIINLFLGRVSAPQGLIL